MHFAVGPEPGTLSHPSDLNPDGRKVKRKLDGSSCSAFVSWKPRSNSNTNVRSTMSNVALNSNLVHAATLPVHGSVPSLSTNSRSQPYHLIGISHYSHDGSRMRHQIPSDPASNLDSSSSLHYERLGDSASRTSTAVGALAVPTFKMVPRSGDGSVVTYPPTQILTSAPATTAGECDVSASVAYATIANVSSSDPASTDANSSRRSTSDSAGDTHAINIGRRDQALLSPSELQREPAALYLTSIPGGTGSTPLVFPPVSSARSAHVVFLPLAASSVTSAAGIPVNHEQPIANIGLQLSARGAASSSGELRQNVGAVHVDHKQQIPPAPPNVSAVNVFAANDLAIAHVVENNASAPPRQMHQCSTCHKQFTRHSNLTSHLRYRLPFFLSVFVLHCLFCQ